MKKILFIALSAMTLASCAENQSIELYCEHDPIVCYTDKNGEFDTLSYATGMNYGLALHLGNMADFNLDSEAIITTINKELKNTETDEKKAEQHQEWMRNFSTKRANAYMMTKQFNSQIKTDRPDTLSLPELFDEEFTREMFQEIMATNIANAIREQKIPANLYWTYEAIRDSKNVGTPNQIDSVMRITERQFNNSLQKYFMKELPAKTLERSMAWYKRVSTKPNVKAYEIKYRRVPLTVYYRINKNGNGTKPVNNTDSISVKYSVYSRTGKLLESNQTQIDILNNKIKMISENQMLPDSIRKSNIANIKKEIKKWEVRTVAFDRFMQPDVREILKLVGEGSNITMWMPASSVLNPMATRNLPQNEAVVINVELVKVKTVEPKITPKHMKAPQGVPATGKIAKPEIVKAPKKPIEKK